VAQAAARLKLFDAGGCAASTGTAGAVAAVAKTNAKACHAV